MWAINPRPAPAGRVHVSCNFSTLLSLCMLLLWLLGRVPIFQRAYSEHLQRLEDDTWLQAQCKDPQFFVRMRQHTNVCEHVRASFQQPAVLVGLQACIPVSLEDICPTWEWQTWAVVAGVVLVLVPNVILPMYRAREDKREHIRVLQACSPMLFPKHHYHNNNCPDI